MRLLLAALLLLLAGSPAVRAAPDTAGIEYTPRLGALVPMTTALRDESGASVTLADVAGGTPLVLALGYFRCPTLCGIVRDDAMSALSRTGLRAGADYRLLVLSIDPDEGPPDAARAREGVLARYDVRGAETGWRFLTGSAPAIHAIAEAVGFHARFDPASKQFLHPAGLAFLAADGTVTSYVLGVGYPPGEVRSAVLRAGLGAVAQAASPVLLLCFHFDPETGRYTFAVYRALSVLAALTAATVGGGLALAHVRGRA